MIDRMHRSVGTAPGVARCPFVVLVGVHGRPQWMRTPPAEVREAAVEIPRAP
jgi:hypothetical protein